MELAFRPFTLILDEDFIAVNTSEIHFLMAGAAENQTIKCVWNFYAIFPFFFVGTICPLLIQSFFEKQKVLAKNIGRVCIRNNDP